MTIKYIKQIDTIIIKTKVKTILLNGKGFRNYCTQYGIPMRTYADLFNLLKLKNLYIPKEIYGYL